MCEERRFIFTVVKRESSFSSFIINTDCFRNPQQRPYADTHRRMQELQGLNSLKWGNTLRQDSCGKVICVDKL